MNIQDKVLVRTAADLEKKYNFNQMKSNQEVYDKSLIKVENELTNMLNSLIINLKDVLDSQSSISLYFYEGIPTTTNAPYTTWTTTTEHIGDLYYDQTSGYIYKYTTTGWTQLNDLNLQSALALTNAELDVSIDHERQVFFSQPIPPYQSGDWWILEDGTLKICQLGKTSGAYETNDFIVSSKYTTTVATKQNDTITVLKGTVTEITENYVKYTDLSTGGSTTIAGENIKTGSIKSNNYVAGATGTKIDLSNGTIDSKNLKLLANGNLEIGGYINTSRGLLTNLQFNSAGFKTIGNYALLGYNVIADGGDWVALYSDLLLEVEIPSNYEIVSANLTLYHTPSDMWGDDNQIIKGWSRNINVYRAKDGKNEIYRFAYLSEYDVTPISNSDLVFVTTIGTPAVHTGNDVEKMPTVDIKNCLKSGRNKIVIRTGNALPTLTNTTPACQQTGIARCVVDVLGYKKIN